MNSLERRYLDFDPEMMMLKPQQKAAIVKMTVLYLMRVVSSQEYSDFLRKEAGWSGRRMSEFRNELKFSGYIQRDIKFYLYEYLTEGTFSLSSSILKEDRAFIQRLVKTEDEYQKALVKQCKAYKSLGYPAKPLPEFCRQCDEIVEELRLYCRKFVIKKLRFVVQMNGMFVDDIVQELIAYGVYAIYRAYPECLNTKHMLNIAKQAAHNRGENIIKESVTKSRSRLIRHEDGTFSAKVLSLHSKAVSSDYIMDGTRGQGGVMVCTSLMAGLDGQAVEGESAHDVDRKRDLKAAIETLMAEFTSPKAKMFLELLMGVHDPKFSAWLGQENDELFDTAERAVYAEKVREYLDVSVERARSFVTGLRNELGDFKN